MDAASDPALILPPFSFFDFVQRCCVVRSLNRPTGARASARPDEPSGFEGMLDAMEVSGSKLVADGLISYKVRRPFPGE
jgi:hypothetical protein